LVFWKKKTVEMMLAELATAGISLRAGVGVAQVLAEHPRTAIEKSGLELLAAVIGDEQFDPKTFAVLEPLSDDVWHFDAEAIEDHGSYNRIVENCCRLARGDLKFETIRDYVDVENEVAWVEVTNDGRTRRIDLKVNNDWVDGTIFDKLQEWLGETGSGRRFAYHSLGQDLLLICKYPEQIRAINGATGLRFRDINV
jgi:hypothetical protein